MGEKVSICIPSYKRVHFLERLLNSISVQTYKNYEVIITDDSEDDTVSDFVKKYAGVLPIFHYKNSPSLGTPRNWMAGMNKATGDWIKLIHDDDWFADENSLQEYMNAVDGKHRFIFSGYNAYYEATGRYVNKTVSQNAFQKVQNNPYLLLGDNIIGPPSVLMIHSSVKEYYDANLKWYVDIEYYMNMLHQEKAIYISAPLINMSYNDTQVTNFCFDNPAIVIPEALHILKKHGVGMVNDIIVYDSFWRSIRNMDIKNTAVLDEHKGNYPVPDFLYSIVKHQQPFSYKTLRKGYISKPLMALSYLLNKKKIVAAS